MRNHCVSAMLCSEFSAIEDGCVGGKVMRDDGAIITGHIDILRLTCSLCTCGWLAAWRSVSRLYALFLLGEIRRRQSDRFTETVRIGNWLLRIFNSNSYLFIQFFFSFFFFFLG
jgi:hypothetical protein